MQPKWHKLPPVPGWYAVAQMAGGKVEGCGCAYYSKWRISELYEEKTFRFYGPLPIEEVENEATPYAD